MKHLHHLFLSCILLTFCLTFTQCEKPLWDHHYYFFDFVNCSNQSLNIKISTRSQDTLTYWDTIIIDGKIFLSDESLGPDYPVKPLETEEVKVPVRLLTREDFMIENPLIHVFIGILPKDGYLPHVILKRYDLTIDSFVQKNWTLVYP